jgi:hypothetical protein
MEKIIEIKVQNLTNEDFEDLMAELKDTMVELHLLYGMTYDLRIKKENKTVNYDEI